MKEYKEKRAEQQGHPTPSGGFQKRIHKLTKEKADLAERLARYESTNGNGAQPPVPAEEPESYAEPE